MENQIKETNEITFTNLDLPVFIDKLYDSHIMTLALLRLRRLGYKLEELGDEIFPLVLDTMLDIVKRAQEKEVPLFKKNIKKSCNLS